MNILFLGAPGSGKGTQSKKVETEFNIPQISTGDLLRAETSSGSEMGEELKKIMSSGKFVSDDIVLELVSKKIKSEECKKGFILDGFPRNLSQASSLDSLLNNIGISLEYVFLIDVPKDLIERPKAGFSIPLSDWLKGPLRDWAESLLNKQRLNEEGYLNSEYVITIWNEHLLGKRNWTFRIWSILMFQSWLESTK